MEINITGSDISDNSKKEAAEILYLIDEVFTSIDKGDLIKDLQPERTKDGYVITCPICGARQAFIAEDSIYIKCNNEVNPHVSINLWDYIKQKDELESDLDVLYNLADFAGYKLPDIDHDTFGIELNKVRMKSNVLEAIADHFKKALFSSNGASFREQLMSDGWSEKNLKKSEIGLLLPEDDIKASLISYGISENMSAVSGIDLSNVIHSDEAGSIVYPSRDAKGKVEGFLVLDRSGSVRDLILSEKSEISNFVGFNANHNVNRLVITQKPLDAALCTILGVKGIVSVGANVPNISQFTAVSNAGIKHLFLVADGSESCNQIIDHTMDLANAKGLLMTNVMILPDDVGSASELILKQGVDNFLQILAHSNSGAFWKAGRLVEKYDLDDEYDLEKAENEIISFLGKMSNAYDIREFLNKIAESHQISIVDLIDKELEYYHVNKVKTQVEQKALAILIESAEIINRGKKLDTDDLSMKIRELRYEKELARHERLGGISNYLVIENAGKKRGIKEDASFNIDRFQKLNGYINGFRPGLYTLAASTGVGVTSFMMNLLTDVLETTGDASGLLFGCDDINENYVHRLISIVEADIREGRWRDHKRAPSDDIVAHNSIEVLRDLDESGRLRVIDLTEISTYEMFEMELSKRIGSKLIVVIDGILNLFFEREGFRNTHMIDDLIIKLKMFALKHKMAIICTVNIKKYHQGNAVLHDHAYSEEIASIANNSNIFWVLTGSDDGNSQISHQRIRLNCIQNKYSASLEHFELLLDPETGYFSEAK